MVAEARGPISDIVLIKKELKKLNAKFKGDYEFTDHIYKPIHSNKIDLNKEFVRIREYNKSAWKHKKFVLVHKLTSWEKGEKKSKKILKEEFDNLNDAENKIKDYELYFKFHRTGSQYEFKDSNIFVEDLEYLGLSIEIISDDKKTLDNMFNKFQITKRFSDCVPKLIERKIE